MILISLGVIYLLSPPTPPSIRSEIAGGQTLIARADARGSGSPAINFRLTLRTLNSKPSTHSIISHQDRAQKRAVVLVVVRSTSDSAPVAGADAAHEEDWQLRSAFPETPISLV